MPHGELIWKGKKTLIVKHKKFTKYVGKPLYLISDKLCYGIIYLDEPREISKDEFDKLRNEHRISDEEVKKWKWTFPLYAYAFKFQKYPTPKPVKIPRGVQVFVDAKNVKFLSVKEMSNQDLEYYHLVYHSCGELLSECCKAHYRIAMEMLSRGLEHVERTSCDRAITWNFMDIKRYDPKKASDRQLGDDFRLALGHYSNMKQGKKYEHWKPEDMVWFIAHKLLPEMVKRGFTFNRPETYTKYAAEAFRKAIKEYGKPIPWKDEAKKLKDLSQFLGITEEETLGRVFGSPTFDDNVLDCIYEWKKRDFQPEALKDLARKYKWLAVDTGRDYFEMFALRTAAMGLKLPHYKLGNSWYLDDAAAMIVESHLSFYPDLLKNNPYKDFKWHWPAAREKETTEEEFKLPEGMKIEDIDPQYVIGLSDEDLIELWKMLVNMAEHSADAPEKIPENIHNAAVFVGIELYKRGLWEEHRGDNILEKAIELEVSEYPTPKGLFMSEDIPEPEGEYILLDDVIRAFQSIGSIRTKGEPYASYLVGRLVNEGRIPKDHDIDLLLRQKPDPRLVVALKSLNPKWLSKRLHVVWDPNGPLIGYSIPIHGYSLNPLPKELMIRGFGPYRLEKLAQEIKVGKPMIGAKPKSGFGKHEFFDPKEMYLEWAKDYLDEGIFVQEKCDGRRMQLHVDKDKGIVKIITEDRQRDRASQFPNIVKEIKEKLNCDSCILDGEMLAFKIPPNKVIKSAKIKRQMDLMEREDTAQITVGRVSPDFEDKIVYVFYDIMYYNGKPVVDLPYSERFKLLKKVVPKNARYLDVVRSTFAKTPAEFMRAVAKMRSAPGSEGVVAKAATSTYPVKFKGENRVDEWAKLKNLKELDVMVWNVVEKKRRETGEPLGNYMYVSVYLVPENRVKEFQPSNIVEYKGKHYAIKCKRGDIITVMPIRIRKYEDKGGRIKYTWMFPYFKEKRPDKKEPDTLTTVERIAKLGTRPTPSKEKLHSLSMEELESYEPLVIIDLPLCEFWKDKSICPLLKIFGRPRYQELTLLKIEHLRFPVACPIANIRRCRYLKSYYYGYKSYKREALSKCSPDYIVEEVEVSGD